MKLPTLPPETAPPGDYLRWILEIAHAGYLETGNGYFAFMALQLALDFWTQSGSPGDGAPMQMPGWAVTALAAMGGRLATARSTTDMAKAIGMVTPDKETVRTARHAVDWLNAALVRDLADELVASVGDAKKARAMIVHTFPDVAPSEDALRQRLMRLRKKAGAAAPTALTFQFPPPNNGGRTPPK